MIKSPPIPLDNWTAEKRRGMTPQEFEDHVSLMKFPLMPTKLFLHHTWKPTPDTWRGMKTILAMKSYYEVQVWTDNEGRQHEGWTAGPHIFVAPDGIWLFSDLRLDGVGVSNHNYRSRHIEMVGDYDKAPPDGEVLHLTLVAAREMLKRMGQVPEQLLFHRDYSTKTCPGRAVTKEWVVARLKEVWNE